MPLRIIWRIVYAETMHRFVGVNGDAITAGMINQIVHVLKSHFLCQ